MSLDSVNIQMFDKPEDAPNYRRPEYEAVMLESASVVSKGTVEGNPTVDLILIDENGQKHVALVKGSFLEAIGRVVTAKRQSVGH